MFTNAAGLFLCGLSFDKGARSIHLNLAIVLVGMSSVFGVYRGCWTSNAAVDVNSLGWVPAGGPGPAPVCAHQGLGSCKSEPRHAPPALDLPARLPANPLPPPARPPPAAASGSSCRCSSSLWGWAWPAWACP